MGLHAALNTRGLWVAEGFTNYYGHLMMRRAGIWDDTAFLRRESQTITHRKCAGQALDERGRLVAVGAVSSTTRRTRNELISTTRRSVITRKVS